MLRVSLVEHWLRDAGRRDSWAQGMGILLLELTGLKGSRDVGF